MKTSATFAIEPVLRIALGQKLGQVRAAPVDLGPQEPKAFVVAYSADYDVNPWPEMFYYPTDTLKIAVVTEEGCVLWKKDLGPGVVPGMWFCPVFPFDLDGDGVDELWIVNNSDPEHPLSFKNRKLERLDLRTGVTTGQWSWPWHLGVMSRGHVALNFIFGGKVRGRPVLVTAQGTYGEMRLQGWNADMSSRWQVEIPEYSPGARGSHMHPLVDINGDGIDEVLWGERCLSLDDGHELFCCDRETYRGHSDMVLPVWNYGSGQWVIYTFRESDLEVSPRVACFDQSGQRIWGDLDAGHMDMGWVARFRERGTVATAIRISFKTSAAAGHVHHDQDEFAYNVFNGGKMHLPFSTYQTIPVDIDGDGFHELARGLYKGSGEILDENGLIMGTVNGPVALAAKFLDLPGEQLLSFSPDGELRVWANHEADDSRAAKARYEHAFYVNNRKLAASGAHLHILGGV